jgi:hypothetical protein
MATYIHDADGNLIAWAADEASTDLDPFDATALTDNNWTKLTGLVAQDATHKWDVATKAVIDITPAVAPQKWIPASQFILRFTPLELQAARDSADPVVQQLVLASTVATLVDLLSPQTAQALGYLASVSIIAPERVAIILG